MVGAKLSKSLIQFYVDRWCCVLSLLLDVRPDYGGSNEDKRASLVAQTVNHLPAVWETRVQALGLEDPLEKEMAVHSSILTWEILWTEKPGGLQSMGSQRVGHN